MLITCPNCDTQFNLPEQAYAPGKKAKCSVCGQVFIMPAMPSGQAEPAAAPAPSDEAPQQAGSGPQQEPGQMYEQQPGQQSEPQAGYDQPYAQAQFNGESGQNPYGGQYAQAQPQSQPQSQTDAQYAQQYQSAAQYAQQYQPGMQNIPHDAAFLNGEDDDFQPAPKVKRGKRYLFNFACVLVFIALVGFVGFYLYGQFTSDDGEAGAPQVLDGTSGANGTSVKIDNNELDRVRHLALLDVRQYVVENDRLGRIVVVDGKVQNNFPTPKELIEVEASLYDKDKKLITAKRQFCGIVVQPLQLRIMGQDQLAKTMSNRFAVLATNVNIQPGGTVPFMVVFVYPPADMAQFGVRVVDAKDPSPNGAAPQTTLTE